MMRFFLTILVTIGVILIGILFFHGFFSTPKVTEKEIGPFTIATTRFVGSYSKVGPVMTEVDSWLRDLGVYSTKGIGLYYDDPAKVAENNLRSDVGNILDDYNSDILRSIENKYEVSTIAKTEAVVVEFPIKSMISYMIAPMKVYPILNKYLTEKDYKRNEDGFTIEIYDVPNKTIQFIIPISK